MLEETAVEADVENRGNRWPLMYLVRLGICMSTAAMVLAADVWTKGANHDLVLLHYRHITPIEIGSVGVFLFALALYRSNLLALAAGLLLGALGGNGGELLLYGYATDWIRVGRWLTNVADLAVVAGLICISADIVLLWSARWRREGAETDGGNPVRASERV
jgi:hypothetical protein